MHLEAVGVGDGGQRGHFLHRVDGAPFGGLAEGDSDRTAVMDGGREVARDRRFEPVGRQLAAGAGNADQATARQELRRAGFVAGDVRHVVAEDDAGRLHHRGEGQRVGRRAGGNEEHGNVVLEHFREPVDGDPRLVVGAIGGNGAVSGVHEGIGHLRRSAGPVVAGKIHGAEFSLVELGRQPPSLRTTHAGRSCRRQSGIRPQINGSGWLTGRKGYANNASRIRDRDSLAPSERIWGLGPDFRRKGRPARFPESIRRDFCLPRRGNGCKARTGGFRGRSELRDHLAKRLSKLSPCSG